jgi:hypothetical protein
MKNDQLLKLVFCKMMLLFNVDRIDIVRIEGNYINAVVGWPNEGQLHYDRGEEQQEVAWSAELGQLTLEVSTCIDYLIRASALRGDRIVIEEPQLSLRLMNSFGWDIQRTKTALSALLSIRIEMIDDGAATDAFFLHF